MKRSIIFVLLIIVSVSVGFAQERTSSESPLKSLSPESGYIMINELTGGFGLGDKDVPYAKGFFGFTTIHGYQVNKAFVVAGGTGINFYNEGTLVPLFLDLRYRAIVSQWSLYIFGDGGVMLDFSENKDFRLFINPGVGGSYTISQKVAINLGAGLLTQFGDIRDSFINLKMGMVYKF
jgi:hypothetical protein